ncbi:REP-associated tyrosine transposase [Stutzerimonas nitrititolerans]|uniref:REP-associated tyrosine transposase n=1 Tax=Stutzerimonas nitrititolerans TaxID=2482751 RepID=UPI00289BB8B7|nr:transposase [Stutzerimonas nitrititolerans]
MSRYRRAQVPGATYFFTVNLLNRRSDLLVRHIDLLRETVRATRSRHPFHIDAWVVLPDHMHCVWTLPDGDADFALRWKVIKFAFARRLLVKRVVDWPYSSFHRAVRDGVYPVGWCGDEAGQDS